MENDVIMDKHLQIHTTGRDDTDSNYTNFPYEPTPYSVLDKLCNSGYITKKNTLVDFGCGKGRVDFYLSFQTKCHSIGVEYNERIISKAYKNKETGLSKNRVEFVLCNAKEYSIPDYADRFYFFNPFSIKILVEVLDNIKKSYDKCNREILLFFYYPSEKYVPYLTECSFLSLIDDIDCMDVFNNDDIKERVLVFELK